VWTCNNTTMDTARRNVLPRSNILSRRRESTNHYSLKELHVDISPITICIVTSIEIEYRERSITMCSITSIELGYRGRSITLCSVTST
jgi:hypothetical protein